ncbi:cation channel sperm-associated protein 4-like [Acropora millepora]|uniref:cation channel sperm-associated protein 4-like n=1 Tax=Acropora millepora TaxID=45264 RepID=UPI001CF1DFC0|nr:cation channel sperm-associated protein 4-like [Acropora millepora]
MNAQFKKAAKQVLTLNNAAAGFSKHKDKESRDATNKPGEASNATRFKSAVDKVRLKLKVTSLLKNSTAPEKEEDKSEKEFQAVFHANQNEKESLLMSKEKEEENMWDIVDLDDEAIKEYASNELLGQFLSNTVFRTGILCVILFNGVLIAVETNHELEQKYSHLFSVLDQCLMTIFVCEILVKWYHGFFMFWRRGWNVLDFFIVIALLLGPLLSTGSGSRGVLRILRVLRAFRSLRSISSLPGLQIVVQTILQSIPDMANIVLLLVIIMLVFSVIAVTLFRDVVPMYFGNLSSSMFYLFVCLTQDGWVEIFKGFQAAGEIYDISGGLFLVVFIAIGAFVFANLVVAVVVTNLEFAMLAVKTEGKERETDELKVQSNDEDLTAQTVGVEDVPGFVYLKQMPFQIPDLTRIPLEKVESYFLILSAIEQNLAQAKKIQGEVSEILAEMFDIQEKAKKEGILRVDERPQTPKSHERLLLNDGDLMSNLMAMESGRVFNSQKESLGSILREGARVSAQKQTSRNVKDK